VVFSLARAKREHSINNSKKRKKKKEKKKNTHLPVSQKQPVQRHEHGLPDDLSDVPRGRGHAGGRGGPPLEAELGEPEGEGAACCELIFVWKNERVPFFVE
jgi:hypothetical protein